jgi:dihydroflavonol-4-reductase
MTATVAVTGASGFIAKHVVQQLLAADYRVRGTLRTPERAAEVRDAVLQGPAADSDAGSRLSFVTLDLATDQGWDEALEGASALVHTASPFPLAQPADEQSVIAPAVQGTLRALRAAQKAGVDRVVMTSSSVAIMFREPEAGRPVLDERDWTDLDHPCATPYARSKTLAERAAWNFVREEAPGMRLTTINPAFVLGPPLDRHYGTSLKVIERLLRGRDPMLPRFGFPTVDVRDIALMHMRALERPAAAGQRYIGGDEFLWFRDMALALRDGPVGRSVVTRQAPDMAVRLLALFDREIRTIVPNLGRIDRISADKARNELGVQFRSAREAVVASGQYIANELAGRKGA